MSPTSPLRSWPLWGIYGAIYFAKSSKARGKAMMLTQKPA